MKKVGPYILGVVVSLIIAVVSLYVLTPALNVHNPAVWIIATVIAFIFVIVTRLAKGKKDFGWITVSKRSGSKGRTKKTAKFNFDLKHYLVPMALAVVTIILGITSSTFFNATKYSEILKVTESDFEKDLSESVGTDSIALMDTASAQMLGDREIGALSDVVSQFDVSYNYTQIDYQGKPIKVAPLVYAGYFKWANNRDEGIKGYVTVDPVSMSASFKDCEGMK